MKSLMRMMQEASKSLINPDNMKRISQHISYKEATKSRTAVKKEIDNNPGEKELKNMGIVARRCFEPIRKAHGKPIGISSFYRSKELNKAVGGSKTSQHVKGMAIDIDADIYDNGITNADIFNYIRNNCRYTQLIWEYGTDIEPAWVHVSYDPDNLKCQILQVKKVHGKSRYIEL